MKNIDFLPQELLHRNEVRTLRWWWLGVSTIFAVVIGATSLLQYLRKAEVREELAQLKPMLDAARINEQRLAELNSLLQQHTQVANLYAFIDHSWPRSRLLAELLGPLPESLRLGELTFAHVDVAPLQAVAAGPTQVIAPPSETSPEPAVADMQKLLDRAERSRIVLTMQGTTSDITQLHQYVESLARSSLLEAPKLEALDAVEEKGGGLRFSLRVKVRPPYGMPGGPQQDTPGVQSPPNQQLAHAPR